jgi:Response regulator containing CheY-like receiver domain and AraC-type DNA-binding domain
MKSVLIVDDEDFVRTELKERIDWSRYGYDCVFEANNGWSALRCYKRHYPNLVITDIRMPVMDGLSLCSELKKINSKVKIVILSSYVEFDYLRRAMQLGAIDYLPKHQMDELHVSEVLSRVEMRQEDALDTLTKRVLFRQWLTRTLPNPESFSLHHYGFGRSSQAVTLLRIQVDDFAALKKLSHLSSPDFDNRFVTVVEQCLDGHRFLATDLHGGTVYAAVELEHTASRQAWISENHLLIGRLKTAIRNELDVYVSFTFLSAPSRPGQLPGLHREMEAAIPPLHGRSEVRAFPFGEMPNRRDTGETGTQELLKLLIGAIQERNPQKIDATLRAIWLEQAPSQPYEHIKTVFFRLGEIYHKQIGEPLHGGKDIRSFLMEDFTTFEGTYEYFLSCAHRWLNSGESGTGTENPKIKEVLQYIQSHSHEDLSLNELAERFHFNKSYLSELFKREVGINFSRYLNKVRVENAKNLLKYSDLPVQEVCELAGYRNLAYFISIFKKRTGMSPAKFRKVEQG